MSETALARNDLGDISITISGERDRITGWSDLQIVRGINQAADAFGFTFPWEATEANKNRFRAYRTSLIEIKYRDEIVITGVMELLAPTWNAQERTMRLEGRSYSGVLTDVSAGPPFEITAPFNQVAKELTSVKVTASPDITDITVTIEPGQSIFDILSSVAAAHGLWALPQLDGSLLFSKVTAGSVVADLREGDAPLISVSPSHDLTKRFYRYRIHQTTDGETYTAEAVDNGVDPIRDGKIIQPKQESNVEEAATWARSQGLLDSYDITATVTGWTVNNVLWNKGMTLSLYAPSAMIYRPYEYIVRRATFGLDETGGAVTSLELSFPEVFTGGVPKYPYPWSIVDG